MLEPALIEQLARRLYQAERSRQQIRQISLEHPQIDIADAYRIQRCWVDMKLADGRTLVGHKIGLTSRAMQMASQIEEPDFGALLDDMFWDDGAAIPSERFIVPRVEVELAFILGKRLQGPHVSLFDVLDAVRYVAPALEIIDARSEQVDSASGRPRKVFDTIADNAANAGVVMGGRPVRVDALDLRRVGAILSRNAVIEETGLAAGVLNHPANGVVWLANRLAAHGVALEAGQVILSGSFTRPVYARRGDVFHADYGQLGSVACSFV